MDSTEIITESWFIPIDILMIVCTAMGIILDVFFLFIIILDKTCHTVSMILIANTSFAALIVGCATLAMCIFTLENDLEQIQYEDSLCVFRGYLADASYIALNFSFVLQSAYRYVTTVYPNRLFWRSSRFQILVILSTWIFSFVCIAPFLFTNEIIYDVDNQICQSPLRLSFFTVYASYCAYMIPISLIIFIYYKLVRHVKEMSRHVIVSNNLVRARQQLKMIRRIVILVTMLIIVCFLYSLFTLMSFFNSAPKYHFRIAYIFIDLSLLLVMIALLMFTDPLKASIMKKIKRRPNVVAAIA